MELAQHLILGFQSALQPLNLLYCFLGVLLGTLIGVLPGIGPVATISILLPITFKIPPMAAIIMLAGIYYGAQYGGSTTSILLNIPGEATSVITCLDGYQMARKGRAGPALGMAAIGSFIAGTISLLGLTFLAAPFTDFALRFGPPEYFCLMILALVILTYLAHGSMLKALIMALFGLTLTFVGTDNITGSLRFTFGLFHLSDGFDLVPLIMGLFGISEVLINVEQTISQDVLKTKIKDLLPTAQDWMSGQMAHPARHGDRLLPRGPSGGRSGRLLLRLVHGREEDLKESGEVRHMGRSKGLRARRRPTTPRPRAPSFPSSPWVFRRTSPWPSSSGRS